MIIKEWYWQLLDGVRDFECDSDVLCLIIWTWYAIMTIITTGVL